MSSLLSKSSLLALLGVIGASPVWAANDWAYMHVDTFDHADNGVDYGLNDRLSERRLYLAGNGTWVRKPGAWYHRPIIREWWSQINHPVSGVNKLSFHSELSATMLNSPIAAGVDGGIRISVKTDPVINDTSDSEFTSVMLDASSGKSGWVTEANFGFFIRSNGQLALFQNGALKTLSVNAVPPASTYALELTIKSDSLEASVNGYPVSAALDPIPTTAYLYLGAYIEANTGKVSTFDDLSVRVATSTQKRIRHHGYYWADSASYGEHIPEVSGHTNLNFVESIDRVDANKCANKSCIVQIRHEFWDGSPTLRTDWRTLWQNTFNEIQAKQQYIAAVYHLDEPFFPNAVDPQALQAAINQVNADLATIPSANIKQMAVFSAPELNDQTLFGHVSSLQGLDWVGVNAYVSVVEFGSVVVPLIDKLKDAQPGKSVILIPQTFRVEGGTTTDAQVAEINWLYYNQALLDDDVTGLLYFGFWTGSPPENPITMPLAFQVQKLLGSTILN